MERQTLNWAHLCPTDRCIGEQVLRHDWSLSYIIEVKISYEKRKKKKNQRRTDLVDMT